MSQLAPVLLAAIGNDLMGDDGVGPMAVRRIASGYEVPSCLEIVEIGTAGFRLMDLLAGRRAAVLVDALDMEGRAPGELLRFGRDELLARQHRPLSPHQPAFGEMLRAAEILGGRLETVVLLGVVATSLKVSGELSEAVRASMPRLEAAIVSEFNGLGVQLHPKRSELLQGFEQREG